MGTTRLRLESLIRKKRWIGVAEGFAVACACSAGVLGVIRTTAQAKPAIRTDKSGYIAGEPVTISGNGFLPFENISLTVIHAGGAAEAGAGHERFFATADADGSFTAQWSVSRTDRSGASF